MRNLNQPESIMQGGSALAPYHGLVAPPWGSLRDGPDSIIRPRRIEDWQVFAGLDQPHEWLPCDESSGPLIDRGAAALSYAATGAVTYQQPVPGSSLPWCGVPASSGAGFSAPAATGYSVDGPIFIVVDALIPSTGGDRVFETISSNVVVRHNSTGRISLLVSGSSITVGSVDHRSATLAWRYAIYWEPLWEAGGPALKVWTPLDQVTLTAGSGPGGALAAAGDSQHGHWGATAPSAHLFRGRAVWHGSRARRAAARGGPLQGGRTLLVESGYEVAY